MSDTTFKITTREEKGVFIVTVAGTMKGCADEISVHEIIREQVKNGQSKIVINMKDTKYINSSGTGILFACNTTLHNAFPFAKIALSQPTEKNRNILSITKMIDLFSVYESDEEAITALNS